MLPSATVFAIIFLLFSAPLFANASPDATCADEDPGKRKTSKKETSARVLKDETGMYRRFACTESHYDYCRKMHVEKRRRKMTPKKD